MTVCKKIRVQDVRKLKGNDILHFFCPYTMMMMSRSRTRLLSKKSSIKRGTKRAGKRDGICSSIFHFALFKPSLLLMILSAIMMSDFEFFSPSGWKGKNNVRSLLRRHLSRRFRTSDGRREVRWTHAAFSFLIRSSWLSSSRSRVRIVCVCYALQSTTTVDEFKTPFCFFLLQHSL